MARRCSTRPTSVRATGGAVTVDVAAVSLIELARGRRAAPAARASSEPTSSSPTATRRTRSDLLHGPPGRASAWCVVKDGPPADDDHAVVTVRPDVRSTVPPVAGVRDTTGAGDAFAAGFLAAWIEGRHDVRGGGGRSRTACGVLGIPGAGGRAQRARPPVRPRGAVVHERLVVAAEVADARSPNGAPVVAMESTIYSNFGLPSPAQRRGARPLHGGDPRRGRGAGVDGGPRRQVARRHRRRRTRAHPRPARTRSPSATSRWPRARDARCRRHHGVGERGACPSQRGVGVRHRRHRRRAPRQRDHRRRLRRPRRPRQPPGRDGVRRAPRRSSTLPRRSSTSRRAGVPVLGWRTTGSRRSTPAPAAWPIPHRVESADRGGRRAAASGRGPMPGVLLDRADPRRRRARSRRASTRASRPSLAACEREGVAGPAVTPFVLGRLRPRPPGRASRPTWRWRRTTPASPPRVATAVAATSQ